MAPVLLRVLAGTASRPSSIALGLVLVSLHPTLLALAPIGISSSGVREDAWLYELAFVASALACAAAARTLEAWGAFLRVLPDGLRLASQVLVLVTAGTVGAVLALAPALVDSPEPSLGRSVAGPLLHTAPALLATASAGGLLLRVRLPEGMLPWFLLVVVAAGPLLLPVPGSSESLVCLGVAMLSSAWLLDHRPLPAS